MIHVCFGLYDKDGRYSKFTGTTIASIYKKINKSYYKIKLNKALEQLNKDVKYEHESQQFKELNEIYQKLMSLDSERNGDINNENDINNLNQVSI